MANLRVNKVTTGIGSYHGSIYATGTSSYLFTTVTAPGTDDFTIECYINTDAASDGTQDGIFAINASTSGFQSNTNNQIRFTLGRAGGGGQNGGLEVNINGTAVDCGSNDIIQEGTWHHVAVTRASGTVKIWVDGVEKASGSAAGDVTGTTFVTGYYDGNYTYQGFMSNFRYRKGTAHYTTTFTVPTKPLERTSDTELIFAQSPHIAGNGFSSAIHGGITDIMQVNGNVTANESSPTQLSDTSAVGVVYDGPIKHSTQGYMYFPTGITEERGKGRGIIAGGSPGTDNNEQIEFLDIQSDGVVTEFGELATARRGCGGCSSSTRGLIGGGTASNPSPTFTNSMEFITIATTANGKDFGDLNNASRNIGGVSNQTRGLFAGGGDNPALIDVIDFFTIATSGNATDFGNLTDAKKGISGVGSPTRGLFGGGYNPSHTDDIDFVTIATTGNATDFGNLKQARAFCGGVSSPTRGVWGGGGVPSAKTNRIDFVTIASAGNATDFGDLLDERNPDNSQICSHIRGLFVGGENPGPSACKLVDRITIATTGNATNFGDIRTSTSQSAGCSDSHGGL